MLQNPYKTIFKTYATQEYYYLNHIYKTLTYAMLQITKNLTKKEYYNLNHIYKTLTYAMLQITKPLHKKNTTI